MILSPGENIHAVIIVVHGLGEHIHRYSYMADQFKREGMGFLGVDLPGHGRSEGRRGIIKNFKLLREMLSILLNASNQTFPGVPVYIYGHSLGGLIVIDYLLKNKPKIQGAIITSPWLRLNFQPSKAKLAMASVLRYLTPWITQPTGLIPEHISHDRNIVDNYKIDPLVHDKISIGLLNSIMSTASSSVSLVSELKTPVLLIHGTDDLITSFNGSSEFASRSAKIEFKPWEGGYHELHNEPFKDEVFQYIINWIKKRHK